MIDSPDLSEKKILHLYHSAFYKLFHIPFDWIKPNNKTFTVCGKEHCHPLCSRIMEHSKGARKCVGMTDLRIIECQKYRKPLISRCHAGLCDIVIPIFAGDDYLGCLCAGQLLDHMPDEAEQKAILKNLEFLHLSANDLQAYYDTTRIFTKEELEGLIELLQLIVAYICETYGRLKFLESMTHSDPVTTAEHYIQKHYMQKLTVRGIAKSIGMSESYFQHKFTEQTGQSPINYLNSYRIAKVIELLNDSNMNIADMAYVSGFRSISHFNKIFRKVTGKKPSDYLP